MNPVLIAFSIFAASPSFASEVFSTRVVSTDARLETVPKDLSFAADSIRVIEPSLFKQIFEGKGCEGSLAGKDLNSSIEIKSVGPHEIELALDHRWSSKVHNARVHYVPSYIDRGRAVKAHYVITLRDQVILHASITKGWWGKKILKMSLIQGRGENIQVIPILEAKGH